MQASYSGSNRSVKYLFENATEVSVEQILTSGTPVATITVDGDDVDLYAPAGGGSDVVANPVGTPTDDLDTIEIDGVIYDIPGSGGGSTNYGKFTCDLLFVNDPLPPVQDCRSGLTKNYTLTKSIDDYDAVYFVALTSYQTQGATNDDCVKTIVLKQDFYNPSNTVMVSSFTDGRYLQIVFTSDTAIQTIAYASQSFYCPTLYKVYGLKFENKLINRSDIYSEEERLIGRWTDGKPLYQKVAEVNITSGNLNIWVNHNIQGLSDAELVHYDYDILYLDPSLGKNGSYDSTYKFEVCRLTTTQYYVIAGSGWNTGNIKVRFIIQYTKTTDRPGSGFLPEDPQMVMMSDYYSEDEQVVGRWTDGKPLYQKTYRNIQLTNSTDVTVDSNYSNKNVINFECISDGIENNIRYITPIQSLNTYNDYVWPRVVGDDLKIIVNRDWRNYACTLTVQYTKTTDTPGTGPTKGNLIYLPALYSEEEREVGVWTDGKPLYQKTIKNIGVTLQQNTWTNIGISFAGIDHWEVIFNKSNSSSYDNQYPILYRYYNGNFEAFCQYTIPLDELTIQYTKTTDQPGSGKYLPDGQLAHHYSTSEHIVGTWVDGSTVYERTWDFSSNPIQLRYDDWVDSTIPSSDRIANIIDCKCLSPSYLKIPGIEAMVGAGNHPVGLNYCCNTTARAVGYLTLQYTKSS